MIRLPDGECWKGNFTKKNFLQAILKFTLAFLIASFFLYHGVMHSNPREHSFSEPANVVSIQSDHCFAQVLYMGHIIEEFAKKHEITSDNMEEVKDLASFMTFFRSPDELKSDPDGMIGLARYMDAQRNSSMDLLALLAKRIPLYLKKEGLGGMTQADVMHRRVLLNKRTAYTGAKPFWLYRSPDVFVAQDPQTREYLVGMETHPFIGQVDFEEASMYFGLLLSIDPRFSFCRFPKTGKCVLMMRLPNQQTANSNR